MYFPSLFPLKMSIHSVTLTAAGELEVVQRKPPDPGIWTSSTSAPGMHVHEPRPDTVWKDVYGAVDGKIVKLRTVFGRHVPARSVDEQLLFDESQ